MPMLISKQSKHFTKTPIAFPSSSFIYELPLCDSRPYLTSKNATFLLANPSKNEGQGREVTEAASMSLFWQNLRLGNCLMSGAMRYCMFRKQGFILASRNRQKRERLKRVTLQSLLMQVAGSWQGSPISRTFCTPVCRAMRRFGSVACAASSIMRHAISPLNQSNFSLPELLRVVRIISAAYRYCSSM